MPIEVVKGQVFSDQMHRISQSLTDGELLGDIGLWPFLTLTQPIDPHRFYPIDRDTVGETLFLVPPEGKIWKVHHAVILYACNSEVAERTIMIDLVRISPDRQVQRIFQETRAADENGVYQIGGPAPTANAYATDRWDDKPVLSSNVGIRVKATNMDAGDNIDIWASIEEWINYEP